MKKTMFSDEKIAAILRQTVAGTTAMKMCRRNGISEEAFYSWKKRFVGKTLMTAERMLGQLHISNDVPTAIIG